MKHFKKRTLALVLASVVTVVGAFGADSYKNSLMGLSFETSASGDVKMVVQTKIAYSGNVNPIKKDANTYVLMLPEMNSLASTPDLTNVGNVSSVNIRTMPYSNNAKGYTRITVRTVTPSVALTGQNQIYIATAKSNVPSNEIKTPVEKNNTVKRPVQKSILSEKESRSYSSNNAQNKVIRPEVEDVNTNAKTESQKPELEKQDTNSISNNKTISEDTVTKIPETKSEGNSYYFLWALLIVLASAYFYVRAKNKMTEIAGEQLNIDIDDEKEKKPNKKQELSKIKKTIKTLDSAYSKTSGMVNKTTYNVNTPVKTVKPAEELNVVDLDELFKEQSAKTKEEEENIALEDFLSGFSFDEEFYQAEQEQEENNIGYDEEFYEQIIKSEGLKFTSNDITCINQLLGSEINDETMRNLENFAMTNPIKGPSKQDILENLVTTYAISQNIIFTNEDVKILEKLVNIEIDKDFITDLRTNPLKVKEMQKNILEYGDKPKKPSEIVTLSVKDLLPDLSEALKKQGNKRIESEYKAETVYYTKGYDVSTLSLKEELPDLSAEINKKEAYQSVPSADYQIVDDFYSVGDGELKISSELPDLNDVVEHPEKYEKQEEKQFVVDTDALLNSISNVQFKPIDDGLDKSLIINEIEEIPEEPEIILEDNLEEKIEEKIEPIAQNELQKQEKQSFTPQNLNREIVPLRRERKMPSEDVLKKINLAREERKANIRPKEVAKKSEKIIPTKCLLGDKAFSVVSSVELKNNIGCYLAKNDNGYVVISYVGEKISKIKEYPTLKSEKIQARLSETLSSGTQRFLIRIGINKFVVDVIDDSVQYVMDLC